MVKPASTTCNVAFKEWAGVCDALYSGRQSLFVRKGGISEEAGAGVFEPEHVEFWLYPTWVHQAEQGLRAEVRELHPAHGAAADGSVPIRVLVRVEATGYLESEESLAALDALHVFTPETIIKRFRYRKPGLWILGVRAWRHEPGFRIAASPAHAGCKTWVELEEGLTTSELKPVLDDQQWARQRERLQTIIARERARQIQT
jgi:hypothetical protein